MTSLSNVYNLTIIMLFIEILLRIFRYNLFHHIFLHNCTVGSGNDLPFVYSGYSGSTDLIGIHKQVHCKVKSPHPENLRCLCSSHCVSMNKIH